MTKKLRKLLASEKSNTIFNTGVMESLKYAHVHPENPQQRLIDQAVELQAMLWSTLPMLPMQSDA